MKKKVFREKYNNPVEQLVQEHFKKIAEEILEAKPKKKTTKKKKSEE